MKVLSGLMMFILLGVYANAQQEAKVVAEIAAGNEKLVKNSPFSADAISESVQALADGNRIVRNSTSKLYRNSEGRFRREMAGGAGGVLGTYFGYGQGISILDPVVGHRVMLDTNDKTARVIQLDSGQNIAIGERAALTARPITDAQRVELEAKVRRAEGVSEEQRTRVRTEIATVSSVAEGAPGSEATTVFMRSPAPGAMAGPLSGTYAPLMPSVSMKFETRSEELGSRDFEGVSATGTRSVTTIPADAIGNERPIEITYERWYSKELELVVFSKHSDPRFGEQTYRLTNIVRSEPDPSLFTVPSGYRVLAEPVNVYKITTKPAQVVGSPRSPQAPRAVTVNATKP